MYWGVGVQSTWRVDDVITHDYIMYCIVLLHELRIFLTSKSKNELAADTHLRRLYMKRVDPGRKC